MEAACKYSSCINGFETAPEIINPILKIVKLFYAHLHVIVFTDSDTADAVDYMRNENKLKVNQKELEKIFREIKISSAHLRS